ncbi:hypothetical protein [Mycobacterium sp.]|uniref:hypothetical protein n=1 Tax=Mycobacterium sp. TaxID=1785 RepID=UPI00127F2C90|nr:hypothetical protein [Mycobacterium sp.]KAA8957497.1 MAG: hypothetical protein F6Q13_16455 [Mycobacterium sp.]
MSVVMSKPEGKRARLRRCAASTDVHSNLLPTQLAAAPALAWEAESEDVPVAEDQDFRAAEETRRLSRAITRVLLGVVAITAVTAAALGGYADGRDSFPWEHIPHPVEVPSSPALSVPPAPPSAAAQRAATKAVCRQYVPVDEMVVSNTHMENPKAGDPVGQLAVAANARLALVTGSLVLHDALRENPATPPALAKPVRAMSKTLMSLGAGYLAGEDTSTLRPERHLLDREIRQITVFCPD